MAHMICYESIVMYIIYGQTNTKRAPQSLKSNTPVDEVCSPPISV